ncbi:phosphatidylserine decarboxylase [Piedraia hortae CBS 480.64]|uniref:Phosphatidylserine decarboxylase proenzyme 1, mitochondrial n=1 Tax=Piedraia hortae CBS 480.64 TaxID=1314780 RepID=A0A6A7C1Y5_9PEZI|nr:phosphatidylserine decarboxylase [Piedraia hortae CBS 480.64]
MARFRLPFITKVFHRKASFSSRRLRTPIFLGIAAVGGIQIYRVRERNRLIEEEEEWLRRNRQPEDYEEGTLTPRRRERIRPSGPWTVQVMSSIPLKALSRWWGWFNGLQIPKPLRVPGFKLYGWVFGVNFDEIDEKDLSQFRNLAEFFYRTLKPGVRPIDCDPNSLVSPADGTVVQFGSIVHGEVEQVKGVTYHVDALLGQAPTTSASTKDILSASGEREGEKAVAEDEEFARVNGISYSLPDLFSGGKKKGTAKSKSSDQSTKFNRGSEAEVQADLASGPNAPRPWYYPAAEREDQVPTALYYCVVYLAPGDYHRFHSPVSWVVESRRHFAGELYSVSPYLVRSLPGLFTLNERVVLLGRWKYGFFSYTPVGATNVGSIVVNFDRELRTNSLLTDTLADRAAEKAAERGEPYSGFAAAHYSSSSPVLGGHPLRKGEEMGGFQLGSTIVMVFEAPKGRRPSFDEGWTESENQGSWTWCIEKGMKVKMGQKLGTVK